MAAPVVYLDSCLPEDDKERGGQFLPIGSLPTFRIGFFLVTVALWLAMVVTVLNCSISARMDFGKRNRRHLGQGDRQPVRNAIIWRDRRTAPHRQKLKKHGLEKKFPRKTGLLLDP